MSRQKLVGKFLLTVSKEAKLYIYFVTFVPLLVSYRSKNTSNIAHNSQNHLTVALNDGRNQRGSRGQFSSADKKAAGREQADTRVPKGTLQTE